MPRKVGSGAQRGRMSVASAEFEAEKPRAGELFGVVPLVLVAECSVPFVAVREKISDGDKDIDMDKIDDVVINVAKSDEPVVVIHDEIDVDDDEDEDTRFDGVDDDE